MKNLSKEKRQQLVLVILISVMALTGIGLLMLKPQLQKWESLKIDRESAQQRLAQVKQTIENAEQIEAQLCDTKKRVEHIEEDMATGDVYSWTINTIRQFKTGYKVEIPQFSQIDGPRPMTMLPQFPYQQASLTIGGTAQFNELGKFLMDFENHFPYMRIMNLSLEPNSGPGSADKERLSFRLEIATLVKPGAS